MKRFHALSLVAIVLLWSAATLAQDPVKVDSSHYKVVLENAAVRVLKIDYAPGAKSVMHQHPDSIVVMLGAGKVRFTLPDGKAEDSDMPNESATYSPAGTHNPTNVGSTRVDALLVEFKTPAPGKATLPTSRPGMTIKTLAEGPRAMAYRATSDASFSEPAGSKHDFDQVVIALGAAELSLAIDGKPARTKWARGDAVFIGRNVAHEAKNLSGKPVDFVIVAIK
jgi:quercetin dioxygenase-like cupin family protein